MTEKEQKVSFHTRFGLRFLQMLLILFALLLIKRCVHIYNENKMISEQTIQEYFDKGYASGLNKAQGLYETLEPSFNKYGQEKAYRDGYRQGWDKGREEQNLP